MLAYQHDFLEFVIAHHVLRFGHFTLKSGRQSNYFFDAGLFNRGTLLAQLGRYYAAALQNSALDFDVLFGPAYKGIPLVTATAIALADQYQRDVPFCFNRKEIKDHGEGGSLVGAPLSGRVLLVDDVITAGTAIGEAFQIIQAAGAQLIGVVVAFDRQEPGLGSQAAALEIAQRYGIQVVSILCLADVVQYLRQHPAYSEWATILGNVSST